MEEQGTGAELDLSVEQKSVSKKKPIILIAAVLLVLVGVGAAATLFLTADDGGSQASAEGSSADAAQGSQRHASDKEALYHPLRPPFVVSLEGRPKTLQVGVHVLTRDEELVEFLQDNDPLIRDRILSLLMEQDGSKLKTRAGKKALQKKLEKEIRKIAKKQAVKGDVEALYFTKFVMQ